MAGEDKVMVMVDGRRKMTTVEDNLHTYAANTGNGSVAAGKVVALHTSSGTVELANTDSTNRPPIGVVEAVSGSDYYVVASGGIATSVSGLTVGTTYYLDHETAGGLSSDSEPGSWEVGVALETGKLLITCGLNRKVFRSFDSRSITLSGALVTSSENVSAADRELHVADGSAGTVTANSDAQLVVESNVNPGIQLLIPDVGTPRGRIIFGNAADEKQGLIEYKPSVTRRMLFHIGLEPTGSNEAVRMYGTGESLRTDDAIDTAADFFTNGHQYYSEDAGITVGDCCVLQANGKIVRSSSVKQSNVAGIAWIHTASNKEDSEVSGSPGEHAWDHTTTAKNGTVSSKVWRDSLNVSCNRAVQSGEDWVASPEFKTVWKVASIGDSRQPRDTNITNLLGFKVCDEGGAISVGDLLCTSSIAGHLMKQDDDIIRSYTVGKAMQDVTFDSEGLSSDVYGYIYCG
tara:strand:+ start:4088 stop:5467 length:1380 start_codon:yes stop_codon:yes gene_type:complete